MAGNEKRLWECYRCGAKRHQIRVPANWIGHLAIYTEQTTRVMLCNKCWRAYIEWLHNLRDG